MPWTRLTICLDDKHTLCLDRIIHPKRSAEGVVLAWVCTVIVCRRRGRAGRLAALAAPPLMRRGGGGLRAAGAGAGHLARGVGAGAGLLARSRGGLRSARATFAPLRVASPPRIRAPTARPSVPLRPPDATLRPPRSQCSAPFRPPHATVLGPAARPRRILRPPPPRRSRTEGRRAQRAAPPSPAAFTFVSASFPL